MRHSILVAAVALVAAAARPRAGPQGRPAGTVCTLRPPSRRSPTSSRTSAARMSDVTGIVPEGTNSHTFEPAPSDAAVMSRCRHRVHQRPAPRGANAGARRGERAATACPSSRSARRPSRRISTSTTSRSPRKPATRTPTCGRTRCTRSATRRSSATSSSKVDPANAAAYEANDEAFAERIDELDRLVRDGDRYRAAREPQAAHLPRLLPVLRRASTAGRSSARSSRPTSPTRRRRRWPR